jgi:phosphoglycerate kinase
MKQFTSLLPQWDVTHTPVFVRTDLNVSLFNGTVANDFKLQTLRPTLDMLLQKRGRIILATHLGRPTHPTPLLSTSLLLPWFIKHGYNVTFFSAVPSRKDIEECRSDIILLENLRFSAGEQSRSPAFAQSLAVLADYYIADGFGVLHRQDSSVTQVPDLFSPGKKTFGLSVEQELNALYPLRTHPPHPFCLVLGGAKVKDKLSLLQALLPKIDSILVCPPLCFTIAYVLNIPVGKSLIDITALNIVTDILKNIDAARIQLILPSDYQISYGSNDGPFLNVSALHMPSDAIGISIGPVTATLFANHIRKAHAVLFAGAPGFLDKPETLQGTRSLLLAIQKVQGTTIVAGGDTVAQTVSLGLTDHITHCSSGGGATIAYLSGIQLPGLVAIGITN